jgi:putative membrane protein
MITSRVPRTPRAWRSLALPLAALLVWDVGVTVVYLNGWTEFGGIRIQYTIFGTAIALFVGFMVNAAYARWWEARTLWGQVVNSSRSLAREALVLLDPDVPDARPAIPGEVVRAQVAYVHVLRTALRGQELPAEAAVYLPEDVLAQVRSRANRQTAVLTWIGGRVSEACRRGMVGELSALQLEQTLVALTDAQGGLERINNTPMPVQYRFLPRFFARLFCVILPFAVVEDLGWATPIGSGLVGLMFLLAIKIGDELGEPFVDGINDVPMTALCRTIEIDLVQMLDQEPPQQVAPVDHVLW